MRNEWWKTPAAKHARWNGTILKGWENTLIGGAAELAELLRLYPMSDHHGLTSLNDVRVLEQAWVPRGECWLVCHDGYVTSIRMDSSSGDAVLHSTA